MENIVVDGFRPALQLGQPSQRTRLAPVQALADVARLRRASWAFTTRRVPQRAAWSTTPPNGRPLAGDLVLARVDAIGHHDGLQLPNGRRRQLFVGDEIVLAYGNRYACSQFEALVPETMGPCHLVAAGGIAARAVSWHDRIVKGPTHITPIALLANEDGRRINVRDFAVDPIALAIDSTPAIIAVVGSAMDSGKTQTAAFLVRGLAAGGLRVGYAKVTGTGAGGDTWFLKDAGANPVLDFTDAGLASTYMASPEEIDCVLVTLIAHIARQGVNAIVLEIADGIFQRETAALLRSAVFARLVGGTVLAARDAMGASAGAESLRAVSIPVLALSGLLSASPLQCAEARAATGLPVYTREGLATAGNAMEIIGRAQSRSAHHNPPERVAQVEESVMVWSLPRGRVLQRVLQADPSQAYVVYIPRAVASGAPIFVAVHGLSSNPIELARAFSDLCEATGVVMVAPVFTAERHADYQRLGRAGRGVRADLALDRCVAEVASLTTADARRIHLFGYSGGAQFAHRYLMAHPHRVARAAIGSAGWYTFPDTRERFPYGIRRQRSLPGVNFDPQEFLRVPITVLVGEADVGTAKVRSTARCNAQQGVNRLERARNWTAAMRTAAQAYGYEPCVSCIEVPEVDHSFTTFCERGALAQRVFAALFDVPVPIATDTEAAPAPDLAEAQARGHG
jgi:pimeloyl-ACP methyl ester carboxylesterase